MNLYSSCDNAPLAAVDPNGLDIWWVEVWPASEHKTVPTHPVVKMKPPTKGAGCSCDLAFDHYEQGVRVYWWFPLIRPHEIGHKDDYMNYLAFPLERYVKSLQGNYKRMEACECWKSVAESLAPMTFYYYASKETGYRRDSFFGRFPDFRNEYNYLTAAAQYQAWREAFDEKVAKCRRLSN